MSVEVKFFANFREIVGEGKISLEASNVIEVLRKVASEYDEMEDQIFKNPETEKLSEFLNVLVNGRRLESLDGVETELKDGDTVALFPPVSGG